METAADHPLAAKTKADITLQPAQVLAPIEAVQHELRPETAKAWRAFAGSKAQRGTWTAAAVLHHPVHTHGGQSAGESDLE